MTLERNPNSSNLFYVDPELFPIEGDNYAIKIDEPTGKFSIFPFDSNDINITAHVDGGIGGKTFFIYIEQAIYDSMNYMRFSATDDNWSRSFDDTNVLGYAVLSGDSFAYWHVDVGSSVDSERVTLTFSFYENTNIIMAGPQGIALASDLDPLDVWESAYREVKIDLDPALSSKLITVGQLARLKGSGTASGALSSKLITVGQLARLMGKAAPPDNQKGKLVTLSQLKRVQTLKIVSWADGTDEEIAAMVAAADAGQINLSDYWHEGDTRTVSLSSMPAMGVGESHVAQSVQFVLTDPGHYTLANGKKCNFVVLQKDCLKEYGVMNSQNTNSGGWDACPRRTWCNSVYYNAVPASLRGIFKQFKVRTATGTGTGSKDSTDWFSLFSEKEIFGSTTYANATAEANNSQLTWFKTSSNRVKRVNGSAYYWWERSPARGGANLFCGVAGSGFADWIGADSSVGLAPFGCI